MTKECKRCGKSFVPYRNRKDQKYCGSRKSKTGCSWRIITKRNNERLSIKRKQNRENKKCLDCGVNIKDYDFRCFYCSRCAENRKNTKGWRLRFNILKKFNFTCQYCGRMAPKVELQIDHKFPKSKGGIFTEENLTVACKECNVGKRDSILELDTSGCRFNVS